MKKYRVGQTPGKGVYECVRCGKRLILYSDSQPLTQCTRCTAKHYYKVSELTEETS